MLRPCGGKNILFEQTRLKNPGSTSVKQLRTWIAGEDEGGESGELRGDWEYFLIESWREVVGLSPYVYKISF